MRPVGEQFDDVLLRPEVKPVIPVWWWFLIGTSVFLASAAMVLALFAGWYWIGERKPDSPIQRVE